jgi:predicted RNase H-like HicB family nuclease
MLRLRQEDSRSDGNVLTQDKDYRAHPLATTDVVTIEMERDEATKSFVTFVQELHGMSTFGDTEFDALERTVEMIRGYLESMEERGMPIPLAKAKLVELRNLPQPSSTPAESRRQGMALPHVRLWTRSSSG